jgi:catechol 2,3-dioxygenase
MSMDATTGAADIAATRGEPAAPGSYGESPRGHRLPDALRLGPVRLAISDLDRSLEFYQDVLGMRVTRRDEASATLAARGDDRPLVELVEQGGARPVPRRGRLGLYHFAILLPDRPSLGRFVRHLAEDNVHAGAGDHLVSEAFYLQDPDNLGIEVYADRPRSSWRREGRQLLMATDPVDVLGLVKAAGDSPWNGMPAGTVMGHVHLHVGDLEGASSFYSDALGFDRMVWQYPGALFMGAGGYHHHLGANTWAGTGATPAGDEEARLLEWTIELPDATGVMATAGSLAAAGHQVEHDGDDLVTRDPWNTRVRVRVANP